MMSRCTAVSIGVLVVLGSGLFGIGCAKKELTSDDVVRLVGSEWYYQCGAPVRPITETKFEYGDEDCSLRFGAMGYIRSDEDRIYRASVQNGATYDSKTGRIRIKIAKATSPEVVSLRNEGDRAFAKVKWHIETLIDPEQYADACRCPVPQSEEDYEFRRTDSGWSKVGE